MKSTNAKRKSLGAQAMEACRGKDIEKLTQALIGGADPNIRFGSIRDYGIGDTLLAHCVRSRWLEGMQALVGLGADVDALGDDALTPLMMSCSKDFAFGAEALILAGASVNASVKHGKTALQCAAHGKSPSCIELLIQAGAKANECDALGRSPLSIAMQELPLSIVEKILEAGGAEGLKPNAREKIWSCAGELGRQALELLGDHGMKMRLKCASAAALQAASYGNVQSLEWIAAHGWPMRRLERPGMASPLEAAAQGGSKEACEHLMRLGLSLRRQVKASDCALELLLQSSRGDISGWLLSLESALADQAALAKVPRPGIARAQGEKPRSKSKRV